MKTTINGLEWEMTQVCAEDSRLRLSNGDLCIGTTREYTLCIAIDKDLPKDVFLQTVRHELTHAFLISTQLVDKKENFTDEEICEFVAKYGAQIEEISQRFMREEFGEENSKHGND